MTKFEVDDLVVIGAWDNGHGHFRPCSLSSFKPGNKWIHITGKIIMNEPLTSSCIIMIPKSCGWSIEGATSDEVVTALQHLDKCVTLQHSFWWVLTKDIIRKAVDWNDEE